MRYRRPGMLPGAIVYLRGEYPRCRLARAGASGSALQPRHRRLSLREGEMAHLRLHEVPGELRQDGERRAVAHGGDAPDQLVVLAHEAHVADQRAEALPAGEAVGDDHQSLQLAVRLDERIDERGDLLEIGGGERPGGEHHRYAVFT